MEPVWMCRTCHVPLEMQTVVFEYLGRTASQELPRCPKCGQVLVSGALAEGKMADVEASLEDK